MQDLSKELPYIKPIYIGPNPQDRKIFMIDYDNKGYCGGTDTFTCKVKLDKELEKDVVFDVFLKELYKFDFNDYPVFFRRVHEKPNYKIICDLIKRSIEFLGDNGQIGQPTFIIIKEEYLKDEKINNLVKGFNIILYDKFDIIIGRKNTNPNIEPGLYLSYNSFKEYSIDVIGYRAKNQYLILKINK